MYKFAGAVKMFVTVFMYPKRNWLEFGTDVTHKDGIGKVR